VEDVADLRQGHRARGRSNEQKKLIEKLEEVAKSLFEPARQQYAAKLEEMKKGPDGGAGATITKR
jgi:hypothetical protein